MKRVIALVVFTSISVQSYCVAQGLDTLWTRTCGGADDDFGYSIIETGDGGIVVTGCTRPDGLMSFFDLYTVKFDALGDIVWSTAFGSPSNDIGYSVIETNDNGLIIAGASYSSYLGSDNALLIKTDSNGDTLWTKQFAGAFMDVLELNDGSLIAVGLTYENGLGGSDILLLKTDTFGNMVWTRTIGGSDDDFGNSISKTSDDGFIICGSTYSYGQGSADIYLVKVNSSGETLWTRTFGNGYSDFGKDVLTTQDNNFIAIGTTHSYGTEEVNIYVIKVDESGNTVWSSVVGGGVINIGNSICELSGGSYLINGTTLSWGADHCDGFFVGLSGAGDTLWTQTYGGYEPDEGSDIVVSGDGSVLLSGSTESFGAGDPDIYLLKLSSVETGISENPKDLLPVAELLASSFPNPFNSQVSIRYTLPEQAAVAVEIYDLIGRRVASIVPGAQESGEHNVMWNADGMTSGVYFYSINAGNRIETRKMVLLR